MPVNYDQAVEFYDATRGYIDRVAERYRDALLDCLDADTSTGFLELGIGSGLIAQPFMRAAQRYVGIDLSQGMMRLIQEKLADGNLPTLAQADCAHLPFAPASFDIVHAVRVFHHLSEWRQCIDEGRRVLQPGGALVIVENLPPDDADPPPWSVVQDKWDEILRGLGLGTEGIRHGVWLTEPVMSEYLRASGARADFVDLLRYREKPVSCRIMVERRIGRMFSSDWRLPATVHEAAARALQNWLDHECAEPDDMVVREMLFRAVVARW